LGCFEKEDLSQSVNSHFDPCWYNSKTSNDHFYNLYNRTSCSDEMWLFLFFLSLFLSYSDHILPTYCRCTGLLLHLITLNNTHTHYSC